VLPAEANRQAQEILARGRAAIIRERGRAVSTALGEVNEAWKEAGPHARQISITQNLESILAAAVEGVNKISVDSIRVIDNGDGEAMRNYIASYPKILSTIFTAVDDTVGIDIPGTLKGQGVKN
jgi:flotillin